MNQRFIAPESIDWASVAAVTYQLDQSIRYDYALPIRDLRHRLVITPRDGHGDQQRLTRRLSVTPEARPLVERDVFGNEVVGFNVPHVERSIAFHLRSEIVRDARRGPHVLDGCVLRDPALFDHRRLIRVDDVLADAGARIRALHPRASDRAEAIVRYVHGEMIYTKAVTDIFTTAAVAFRMRRGVCQDYAHVAIALARTCGVAARYVSGHCIGEGATHAWVEFLVPQADGRARVLSFDPTTGRPTDWRYVVVAVGRDYEDVTPTSGVFVGEPTGLVGSSQTVRITNVTLAA